MNHNLSRTLTRYLVIALSIHSVHDVFAQDGQVNVQVPLAPVQPAVDATKPEGQAVRKGTKSKYVLALPKEYEARDKNGDGQIGLYEWDRTKYAEFFKLDKNGDGFLTAQELIPKVASSVAKMRIGGETDRSDKAVLPNPGNLVVYNQRFGETMTFTVTGQSKGTVRGTGSYTTDSDLATVAVHAGILKDGETGTVRVTIIGSPAEFTGSTTNGITSESWPQGALAAYTVR